MKITASGQVSIPAEIRRRWNVARLRLEDHGDHVTLEPVPDDVFTASIGRFAGPGRSWADMREEEREIESEREVRRYGSLRRVSTRSRPAR
jgi:AbrB family looped-hinge helix DNA binding protein